MDQEGIKTVNSYTCSLGKEQIAQLRQLLDRKGYQFVARPHVIYAAQGEDVFIGVYRSGKLLVQGRGTTDFVQFLLEPEILKEVRLGYEDILQPPREERIGVDESGKGDYFGPLVVAGVFFNKEVEKKLKAQNIRDSKKLSDRRIKELRKIIRRDCIYSVVAIGPERYNQLYATMGNMNRILAWGHARVIENILSKVNCQKATLDQFGRKDLVLGALMKKGRNIEISQQFRGESDPAIAAASVLARGEFILRLKKLSGEFQIPLPLGNKKDLIIETARRVIKKWGLDALVKVAKVHFKTTREILAEQSP